jgi:hypothetical protein
VSAKPSDFFIGVLDFFAVLLPGALATYAFHQEGLAARVLERVPTGAAGWVAFALSSYLAGHLIFLMGAGLDASYDRQRRRKRTPADERTFQAADALRKKLFVELDGASLSTFKWAKAYVHLRAPEACSEIERFEATSKFFRSLVVLFILGGVYVVAKRGDATFGERLPALVVCFVLMCASFSRFCDQRWKSTELAYLYAILLYDREHTKGPDWEA